MLHDEVKLVSIAVGIVCSDIHIVHLLLYTTCGSSHYNETIIGLGK